MITITMNDDYSLSCDTNVIPAQFSSNIPFKLELPTAYKNALVVPAYVYWDGNRKVESAVDNYKDGNFRIPSNAFSKEGMLGIAFSITLGDVTETTTIAEFEVRGSVNTSFSLPQTDIWQSMLQNFMDQYMDKVYSSIINALIDKEKKHAETAQTQQSATTKLQKEVNTTINDLNTKINNGEFVPDFKMGTVTTLPAGEKAIATITGDKKTPTLNMSIPQGTQGVQGATGNGIKSFAVTYQKHTSGTTAPTGTWTTAIPEVPANQYLWTRVLLTYTNNGTNTFYSVSKNTQGPQGIQGPAGPTTFYVDTAKQTSITAKTSRSASATKVKVQLQDTSGKALYVETSADNVYIDDTVTLSAMLKGQSFYIKQENGIVYLGTYAEWIAAGKPNMV